MCEPCKCELESGTDFGDDNANGEAHRCEFLVASGGVTRVGARVDDANNRAGSGSWVGVGVGVEVGPKFCLKAEVELHTTPNAANAGATCSVGGGVVATSGVSTQSVFASRRICASSD